MILKTFQQALCAPSRNSMLTSRRPDTLRLYDFYNYWRHFAGNYSTLPQYFKEHGYFTFSIGKVFHPGVSSNFTDDYPISWSEPAFHAASEKYLNDAVCLKANGKLAANLLCPVDLHIFPGHSLPDIESTLRAKRVLLEKYQSNESFFLAVGFHKPHIPFQFPAKYLHFHSNLSKFESPDDNFKPYDFPDVAWNPFTDIRKRDDVKKLNMSFPFGTLPKDFRLLARQHYYASVTYVDDLIGQLVESVDLTNTIVVLTSDHGWSLGEHTEWAKYSNFDVSVKVPLIIYNGGEHKEITSIVELIDLYPTLIDLVGLPKLEKCTSTVQQYCTEGESLVQFMKDLSKESETKFAISQYPRPGIYPTAHPNADKPLLHQIKVMGYSLRTTQFRYTIWIGFDPKTFTKGKNNFFDAFIQF